MKVQFLTRELHLLLIRSESSLSSLFGFSSLLVLLLLGSLLFRFARLFLRFLPCIGYLYFALRLDKWVPILAVSLLAALFPTVIVLAVPVLASHARALMAGRLVTRGEEKLVLQLVSFLQLYVLRI